MIKKSRLSFRISDSLNDDVEKMVILKRDVRDRSDLGNQSVEFFLDLIQKKSFEEQIFLSAIMKIAKQMEAEDLPEVQKIQDKLNWFNNVAEDPISYSSDL